MANTCVTMFAVAFVYLGGCVLGVKENACVTTQGLMRKSRLYVCAGGYVCIVPSSLAIPFSGSKI